MATTKKDDVRMYDVQHLGGGTLSLRVGRKVERDKTAGGSIVRDEGELIIFGPKIEKFAVIFDTTPKSTVQLTEAQWEEMQKLSQVQDMVKRNLLVARLVA